MLLVEAYVCLVYHRCPFPPTITFTTDLPSWCPLGLFSLPPEIPTGHPLADSCLLFLFILEEALHTYDLPYLNLFQPTHSQPLHLILQ